MIKVSGKAGEAQPDSDGPLRCGFPRFVTGKASVRRIRHQGCSLGCSSPPFGPVQPSTRILAELQREPQ
jgi:hypothetical protein